MVCLAMFSVPAPAQVALDQFEPAPLADDGLHLNSPTLPAAGTWALAGTLDYARTPLSYEIGSSIRTRQHVVSNHLVLHVGGAYAVHDRVLLFASLPVHAWMQGETLLIPEMEPEGAGLGDLRVGARIGVLRDRPRGGLAVEIIARAPTAELANGEQLYSGDRLGSYDGALVGELRVNNVDFRARLGVRARETIRTENLKLGSALLFAIGARVRITPSWLALLELNGSTFFASPFGARHAPIELLLGTRAQLGAWALGIGAGPGLGNGYGTPDFRLLLTAAYVGTPAPEPVAEAPIDGDADGVLGDADGCPDEAEDRDDIADADGCPEQDADRDDMNDELDACPLEAEDRDGIADEDGCPERDDVAMTPLACRVGPGEPLPSGCPDRTLEPAQEAVVQSTSVGDPVGFGRIEYAPNKGSALASSIPTLNAVRALLTSDASIRVVRVEGHSDDTGSDDGNERLSRRRARAVVRWLIERGIAAERFQIYNCSDRYPRIPDPQKQGLQANRRVEFHVVDPPSGAHGHDLCVPVPL
ncbi:MAG: OmpA family protein [Polyangiales bacterium]